MAAVWLSVLVVTAPLAGWAQATHLRRAHPVSRVPAFRWRAVGQAGMSWASWLAAGASAVSLWSLLRLAHDDLALATGVFVGWTAVSLLVQAALLRQHDRRLSGRR